jgi:hypothetical protein
MKKMLLVLMMLLVSSILISSYAADVNSEVDYVMVYSNGDVCIGLKTPMVGLPSDYISGNLLIVNSLPAKKDVLALALTAKANNMKLKGTFLTVINSRNAKWVGMDQNNPLENVFVSNE